MHAHESQNVIKRKDTVHKVVSNAQEENGKVFERGKGNENDRNELFHLLALVCVLLPRGLQAEYGKEKYPWKQMCKVSKYLISCAKHCLETFNVECPLQIGTKFLHS